LQEAVLQGSKLAIKHKPKGPLLYDLVILPGVTTLNQKTIKKLFKFVQSGGKLLFTYSLPTETVEKGDVNEIRSEMKKLLKLKNDRVEFIHTGLNKEELRKVLQRLSPPAVQLFSEGKHQEDILFAPFRLGDHDLYLMLNTSDTKSSPVEMQITGQGVPGQLDLTTGEIKKITNVNVDKHSIRFNMEFLPTESMVIVVEKDGKNIVSKSGTSATAIKKDYRMILKETWKFYTQELNVLPLTNWTYRIGGPRDSKIGAIHEYETTIEINDIPQIVKLIFDGFFNDRVFNDSQYKEAKLIIEKLEKFGVTETLEPVSVNLTRKYFKRMDSLDPEIYEVDISSMLGKGLHKIIIKTKGVNYDPINLSEPVYLVGNFVLSKTPRGWLIHRETNEIKINESWSAHGYPYYSGVGIYEQVFEVPHKYRKLLLVFNRIDYAAELFVNDQFCGKLCWEPLQLDITELVKPGNNHLRVKVSNTLNNFFVMQQTSSGIIGDVMLDVYN